MTQPTDAAEVARKLTSAQRRLLCGQGITILGTELDQMFDMGLFVGTFVRHGLTAFGTAVRAQLQGEGGR